MLVNAVNCLRLMRSNNVLSKRSEEKKKTLVLVTQRNVLLLFLINIKSKS